MMIGDTTVGKTSLLVRYADDDFNESVLATIGIDFKIKVRPSSLPPSHARTRARTRAAPLAYSFADLAFVRKNLNLQNF